jgi:hypothetical protein
MNIGIICYASVGGSGIVATELGKALASRGHRVHVISTETPFRFGDYQAGLMFHQVLTPTYPLFREPQHCSIATKVVEVARRPTSCTHYAVPHATAAFLAKQVLARSCRRRAWSRRCTEPTSRCRQRSVALEIVASRSTSRITSPRCRKPARFDLCRARRRARSR